MILLLALKEEAIIFHFPAHFFMVECLFVLTQLCERLPKGLPIYVVNSFHPFAMKRRKVILGKVLLHAATKGVTERSCQICLENKLCDPQRLQLVNKAALFALIGTLIAQRVVWLQRKSACGAVLYHHTALCTRACLFSHRGADR